MTTSKDVVKNKAMTGKPYSLALNFIFSLLSVALFQSLFAAEDSGYQLIKDIPYYDERSREDDAYKNERCYLDLYLPKIKNKYTTVVWFHGGGLRGGRKSIPESLKEKKIAVVAVNYRLFPKVKSPAYIEDAAAAVAWVFQNIDRYGGDANKIVVSGHSAGGYLTSMVGLDKRWLAKHNIDANDIFGLVPFSGHTITHFTVREEKGIPKERPLLDDFAPLYHVRHDSSPLVLITGDRNLELLGRYEENAYMMRMMKVAGHNETSLYEIQGYNHGKMVRPAFPILIDYIRKWEKAVLRE